MGSTWVARCDKYGGLGNRIKNIASCYRFADNVEVYWESEFPVADYAPLNTYFPDLVNCRDLSGKRLRSTWRLETAPDDVPAGFSTVHERFERAWGKPFSPVIPENKTIDLEYHRIPQKVIDAYVPAFDQIRIAEPILDIVNNFSEKNFGSDVVSVHIRTWIDAEKRKSLAYKLKEYTELMDKYDDKRFFIATDDRSILPVLEERYGEERIISYYSSHPEIDSMVDLLLISKNSAIIGAPFSTYTEAAWWMGGCKATVQIAWNDLLK